MKTEQEESPLSEEERRAIRSRLLDRGIFKLYEIGVKWMPIPLMLGHWYGVWDYSRYSRPIILDTDMNGNCVIWLYILVMSICRLPCCQRVISINTAGCSEYPSFIFSVLMPSEYTTRAG